MCTTKHYGEIRDGPFGHSATTAKLKVPECNVAASCSDNAFKPDILDVAEKYS